MLLKQTEHKLKQANFFFEKFKKETFFNDKFNFLSASIVYTKATFDVFKKEIKNFDKKNILDWHKNKINYIKKTDWFNDLKILRDQEIKEKFINLKMAYAVTSKKYYPKIKIIPGDFTKDNKLKVKAKDFFSNQYINLESNEVEYFLDTEIKEKKMEVIHVIKFCLEDLENIVNDFKNKF